MPHGIDLSKVKIPNFVKPANSFKTLVGSTDYRLTDAKVEPFYNEAEKMRNNK